MKTMLTRPARAFGMVLALGVLAGAGPRSPLDAQVIRRSTEPQECRCVDKDGKRIENCSCVRLPNFGRVLAQAVPATRPRLGITLAEPAEGAEARGAEVASVREDGPAAKAGIVKGDIITRVDGKSLLEPLGPGVERKFDEDASLPVQRLMEIVRGIEPGQKVEVEYLRGTERRTTTVEARDLEDWSVRVVSPDWDPEAFQLRMRGLEDRLRDLRVHVSPGDSGIRVWTDSTRWPRVFFREGPGAATFHLTSLDEERLWECPGGSAAGALIVGFPGRCPGGLELLELKPGLADYFGAPSGVLVADVHEDSKLGVQPGDVILAIGDRETPNPDRVRRILESYGADEAVTLRIMRQKREMTVTGTLKR